MKVFILDIYSCEVNYQHDYLKNILKENFSLTKKIEDADAIIIVGGCACTIENYKISLNIIEEVLKRKKVLHKLTSQDV